MTDQTQTNKFKAAGGVVQPVLRGAPQVPESVAQQRISPDRLDLKWEGSISVLDEKKLWDFKYRYNMGVGRMGERIDRWKILKTQVSFVNRYGKTLVILKRK